MVIAVFFALALIGHPEQANPAGDGAWSNIDFWEMGIGQPFCSELENHSEACQVEEVDPASVEQLYQRALSSDIEGNSYYYQLADDLLTIYSLSRPKNSFVCCDIQGPFNPVIMSDGAVLSVAQFIIPSEATIRLMLLNDVSLVGSEIISRSESPYVEAFLLSSTERAAPNFHNLNVPGFDRGIHIYRNNYRLPPEYIFYFKDGVDDSFVQSVQKYYGDQFSNLPSFAFVGIESGDVETRTNEYLIELGEDPDAYSRYRDNFSYVVVPQVEEFLEFEGGGSNRVIVGQSNGGKWVLDYALDFPSFAASIVSMSPGGLALVVEGRPGALDCGSRFYLAVGEIEALSFVRDARLARDRLQQAGLDLYYRELSGGHSASTWAPFFVEAFENIIEVAPRSSK